MSQTQTADYIEKDGKRIFSVSGFLRTTQQILRNLGKAYIQGEVSSISDKYQLFYLVLQDENGSLNCAVPRALLARYKPKVGDQLLVFGSNSLNAKNSQYSFWIEQFFKLDGMGLLAEKLRLLKERLEQEGVFSRPKRALPQFIDRVGVITSEVGSVIHDIELTMQRRNPLVEIYLYPTRVQGEGAALRLVQALEYANAQNSCDVLIIGRGGGSFEDLLPFYDETLVRAVAASRIPIISAVGHETDTPFCDFAADVRAATPTAAAELCTAITHAQLCYNLEEFFSRLEDGVGRALSEQQHSMELATQKLHRYGPEQQLSLKAQRLELSLKNLTELLMTRLNGLKERQQQAFQKLLTMEIAELRDSKNQLEQSLQKLLSLEPSALLEELKAKYDENLTGLNAEMESRLSSCHERLKQDLYAFEHSPLEQRVQELKNRHLSLINTLQALDPLKILKRGYSITLNAQAQLASYASLKVGERIESVLPDGRVISEIVEKKPSQGS